MLPTEPLKKASGTNTETSTTVTPMMAQYLEIKAVNPGFLKSSEMTQLMLAYFRQSHVQMVKTIFKLISRKFGTDIIQNNILKLTDNDFVLCTSIMNMGLSR